MYWVDSFGLSIVDPLVPWTGFHANRALEEAIVQLLDQRSVGSSICPSEAARLVSGGEGWRALMEPARRAARRLVAAEVVVITQGGRVVDPSTAKGPIRFRRR